MRAVHPLVAVIILVTNVILNLVYYPVALHLQEVHAYLGYSKGALLNSERAADTCLSLPMFPEMTEEQQARVVESLKEVIG